MTTATSSAAAPANLNQRRCAASHNSVILATLRSAEKSRIRVEPARPSEGGQRRARPTTPRFPPREQQKRAPVLGVAGHRTPQIELRGRQISGSFVDECP